MLNHCTGFGKNESFQFLLSVRPSKRGRGREELNRRQLSATVADLFRHLSTILHTFDHHPKLHPLGLELKPNDLSGLFLGFWAFSAFFNHFLATALLCLVQITPNAVFRITLLLHIVKVFGAAGDQLTRYMFTLGSSMAGGGGGRTGEVVTLLDLARQEVRPCCPYPRPALCPVSPRWPRWNSVERWQNIAMLK